MHGANRLGGNSLSDLLVFGRRAGLHAAQSAKRTGSRPHVSDTEVDLAMQEALAPFERAEEGGENPFAVQSALQAVMQRHAGIIRDRSEEHTSELQSLAYLVCRLLLEKKKNSEHETTTACMRM